MNTEVYIAILGLIFLIIFGGYAYIDLFVTAKKVQIQTEKENKEVFEYLETVRKRANLSNSMDALHLLYDELAGSSRKYNYSNENLRKGLEIQKFIHGKYQGIKSTKNK